MSTRHCTICRKTPVDTHRANCAACVTVAMALRPMLPEIMATYSHDFCRHGHELSDENLRIRADGSRACAACAREASNAHYMRKKAAS